ncbi:hypothetical protein, partial [Frateuria defendens]|uniref:hypothetical protein n=1 Tax=Frateuria defendens TaxID=2219559 RepID=UPI001F2B5366
LDKQEKVTRSPAGERNPGQRPASSPLNFNNTNLGSTTQHAFPPRTPAAKTVNCSMKQEQTNQIQNNNRNSR